MGGHDYGWMSKEYLQRINDAFKGIEDLIKTFGEEYHFIVTADHGGIRTTHGGDSPEEMNVFLGIAGHNVNNITLGDVCIQDIPAIVCQALGVKGNGSWNSNVPANLFK